MLRSVKFFFCTASTFRSKSKLTEFYKAIHPDMLHNAPDNVKIENTRSLKILNGYFDSVAQNQKTEPQEIIFYVPNKQNAKARKFYPITVTLDAYLQKNMDDTLNRVVAQLNDKISQKQDEISKMHLKPTTFQTSQNYEKIKEDLLSETTSLKRKSAEKQQEYQALQAQLFLEQDRQRARELNQRLMRQMRGSPSPNIKPALWRQLIMEQSDLVPNIQDIFLELIDPRSVYIDEKLTNAQVDLFISKLAPKFHKQRETEKLKGLFKVMEALNIFLLVSDHYSGSDIVGYFSIKYNFDVDELLEQFFLYKESIVKGFQIYENELERYKENINTLLQKYGITKLENQIVYIFNYYNQPLKNTEILQKLNISLLVLIKNLNNVEKQRLLTISEKQWIITDNLDEIKETQTNIYLPLKYNSSFI